jgi:hypothetical protein
MFVTPLFGYSFHELPQNTKATIEWAGTGNTIVATWWCCRIMCTKLQGGGGQNLPDAVYILGGNHARRGKTGNRLCIMYGNLIIGENIRVITKSASLLYNVQNICVSFS